jgi:hypothetical protein
VVTQTGELEFETPLNIPGKFAEGFAPVFAWVRGERWIVIASEYGENGKAKAWWVDLDARKVSEVEGLSRLRLKISLRMETAAFLRWRNIV